MQSKRRQIRDIRSDGKPEAAAVARKPRIILRSIVYFGVVGQALFSYFLTFRRGYHWR